MLEKKNKKIYYGQNCTSIEIQKNGYFSKLRNTDTFIQYMQNFRVSYDNFIMSLDYLHILF